MRLALLVISIYFSAVAGYCQPPEYNRKALKDSFRIAELSGEAQSRYQSGMLSADSLAGVLYTCAYDYFSIHHFTGARVLLEQCLEIIDAKRRPGAAAKCYVLSGEMAMEEDDRVGAIQWYNAALSLYEQRDSVNYLRCLRKIGNNYDYLGDHPVALTYYHECMALAKALDHQELMAATLNNLATIYADEGDYIRAVEVYGEAIALARAINDTDLHVKLLGNLSLTYRKMKQYVQSRATALQAVRIAESSGNLKGLGFGYQSLGYLHFEKGHLDSAASYMQATLEIAHRISNAQLEENAGRVLQHIYYQTGRYKEAYDLYQRIESKEDSLYNLENSRLIESVKAQYLSEKREREIAENNLKLQEADASLSRHQNQRLALIIVVFLLLVILFLIYRGYVIRKKNNEVLLAKNAEVERHAHQVERLNETKSRWFMNVAHELRTPLTLIRGPLQRLLKRNEIPEEMLSDLLLIERNTRTLSNLVNEMLDLSRMEEGEITLKESVFDLNDLVRYVVSTFESSAQRLGLRLYGEAGDEFYILADRDKLYKVLVNLVSNALKFTGKGGEIRVFFRLGAHIEIGVKDSGRGIAGEDLPHVFERFYQSAFPENKLQGGTGIGLALSKEIAEMHGGVLQVESIVNTGSTFTLVLPRELEASKPPHGAVKIGPSQPSTASREKISDLLNLDRRPLMLLVDDHDDMRKYVGSLLKNDFEIREARTGQEGLEILGSSDIRFIISDVMMPEMDGVTFLKHVKADELWRHLPFIHLSAIADDEMKKDTLRIGIDDYLVKPFDPEELIIRVKNLYRNYLNRVRLDSDDDLVSYDGKMMKRLKEEVLANIDDNGFNVLRLADAAAMSERQLYRYLKGATGLTPLQFIQEIKLHKAHDFARRRVYGSVSELAAAVGFKQAAYFSTLFEKRFGKKPSAILKN